MRQAARRWMARKNESTCFPRCRVGKRAITGRFSVSVADHAMIKSSENSAGRIRSLRIIRSPAPNTTVRHPPPDASRMLSISRRNSSTSRTMRKAASVGHGNVKPVAKLLGYTAFTVRKDLRAGRITGWKPGALPTRKDGARQMPRSFWMPRACAPTSKVSGS